MDKGKCGAHHYGDIDQHKIDKMLEALRSNGAVITGSNPWDVDTKKHGIKLKGSWEEASSSLTLIVTEKDFFVPCSKIWENIDPLIHQL